MKVSRFFTKELVLLFDDSDYICVAIKKEGGIVMKNLVVLTGAGMSAESGISTFRDAGGLWDKYPVEQVATPEGYQRDPALVINFYNERRKQLLEVKPNRGHELLAELEKNFHVTVVTQNIDNLPESSPRRNLDYYKASEDICLLPKAEYIHGWYMYQVSCMHSLRPNLT